MLLLKLVGIVVFVGFMVRIWIVDFWWLRKG